MKNKSPSLPENFFTDKYFSKDDWVSELEQYLVASGAHALLVVHGQTSFQKSGAAKKLSPLFDRFDCVSFCDFDPNPTLEEAQKGAEKFLSTQCDAIVAVGGGSAMDIAKLINVFQAHQGKELELATGQIKVENSLATLIAIPTTSGSGSEATHFAVVYVGDQKFSLAHPSVLPDRVVLEPQFTENIQGLNRWAPAFDALCQGMESFWSAAATKETRAQSSLAIRLAWPIIQSGDKLSVHENEDLMWASNLAGRSINKTKTTAPHALSYHLSSHYGIPHGHAVAIFMTAFLSLNVELAGERGENLSGGESLMDRMNELYELMGFDSPDDAQMKWKTAMTRCGLTTSLWDVGVQSPKQKNRLVKDVNIERLGNHPVALLANDLVAAVDQL